MVCDIIFELNKDSPLLSVARMPVKRKENVKMDILQQITQEQIRTDLPQLSIGDTVRVYVKVALKELSRQTHPKSTTSML